MRGRLIMLNVPTKDASKAKSFYGYLLGIDFAQSLVEKMTSFHAPASAGVQMTINNRFNERDTVSAYFAVANLNEEIGHLERMGGKVVVHSQPLPVHPAAKSSCNVFDLLSTRTTTTEVIPQNMGHFAIMRDPDDNLVGLIQLDPGAERFFQSHVTCNQITEHNAAHQLAGALNLGDESPK